MLRLADEAFEEIGEEKWRQVCDHVDRNIERLKVTDHYTGNTTERFVICLDDSSDDSETETADEDSSTDTASETELLC